MLSKAETLLGLKRHLSVFQTGPDRLKLSQLELTGKILEMAMRLRGSGVSSFERVAAIGLDVGSNKRELNEVIGVLESLKLIECHRNRSSKIESISEVIPPLPQLLNLTDSILSIVCPEPDELAVIDILDATTRMPITKTVAVEKGAEVANEESANIAIDLLETFHLLRIVTTEDGSVVVFNPNIWASDVDYSKAALQAEDSKLRQKLEGLIEEVSSSAGLPQESVKSAEPRWIDFAISQGLIQRCIVVTSHNKKVALLFTPHMGKDAFSQSQMNDPSGHVKLTIGSMVYARDFAQFRLYSPAAFLNKLIREGEAGDASAISTDYIMLEKAGIVRVKPATNYFSLELLQSDVVEEAARYLDDPISSIGSFNLKGIGSQYKYVYPEMERARVQIAKDTATNYEANRLVDALRESTSIQDYDF